MILHHGDGLADELFDVPQQRLLAVVAEGDGDAVLAGAAGAADAMDIGFRNLRQVVVKHAGEILNVQSPGGDVGGHQNANRAVLESGQCCLSGGLALVAVDGGGGDACLGQVLRHPVCPVLCAGEHQRRGDIPVVQQLDQQFRLVVLVHQIDALVNDLHRGADRIDGNFYRVVEQGVH